MTSWWNRASVEQRLAQIDGGIELGLTARQVAVFRGLPAEGEVDYSQRLRSWAMYYGRRFPLANRQRGGLKAKRVGDLKRAYFGGVERDFNDAPAVSSRVIDDDFDEAA